MVKTEQQEQMPLTITSPELLLRFAGRVEAGQQGGGLPTSRRPPPDAPPPPELSDDDRADSYIPERFREPRAPLPSGMRTFLRAIAVRPGRVFFTWDLDVAARARTQSGAALAVHHVVFLGDVPAAHVVALTAAKSRVPVDARAHGWYLDAPLGRVAVLGILLDGNGDPLAHSNVTVMPPDRAAPAGPLWRATLPPGFDRRQLVRGALLRGDVPAAGLVQTGMVSSSAGDDDERAGVLPWSRASHPQPTRGDEP